MAEIVGIGACVLDHLIRMNGFPAEDTKCKAVDRCQRGGGPVATGLVAAAKLGCTTAYIGNLANDSSGSFLLDDFKKYGVDTGKINLHPGCRGFVSTVLLNTQTASRTCIFDRGNVPPLELNKAQLRMIEKAKLLMVDGNELPAAIEAAHCIHKAAGKVLYDCGGLYAGVEELLTLTDIMIPSEEFALGHTGCETVEEAAKRLWDHYHPEVIVITRGKQGGLCYEGHKIEYYPAFAVDAVDTNGAGDVFHGAFAACVCKGYSYRQCCTLASGASALKCTCLGARESTPDWDTLMDFLKERNAYAGL